MTFVTPSPPSRTPRLTAASSLLRAWVHDHLSLDKEVAIPRPVQEWLETPPSATLCGRIFREPEETTRHVTTMGNGNGGASSKPAKIQTDLPADELLPFQGENFPDGIFELEGMANLSAIEEEKSFSEPLLPETILRSAENKDEEMDEIEEISIDEGLMIDINASTKHLPSKVLMPVLSTAPGFQDDNFAPVTPPPLSKSFILPRKTRQPVLPKRNVNHGLLSAEMQYCLMRRLTDTDTNTQPKLHNDADTASTSSLSPQSRSISMIDGEDSDEEECSIINMPRRLPSRNTSMRLAPRTTFAD